jgi:tryptophan-rich sensory protein
MTSELLELNAIKCKQYSGITVESGTHVKSVKITLNIFAVQEALNMCWKLCWFNYRPTFGASINALLLATRAHTALTKTNRLQNIQK